MLSQHPAALGNVCPPCLVRGGADFICSHGVRAAPRLLALSLGTLDPSVISESSLKLITGVEFRLIVCTRIQVVEAASFC